MTAAIQLRKPRLSNAEQEARTAARRDNPNTMLMPGLIAEKKRMLAARDATRAAATRATTDRSRTGYTGEPLVSARPGSSDALKIPSLENGQRTAYKPPAAYCVGYSKSYTGSSK